MASDSELIRSADIIEVGSAFSGTNFTEVLDKVNKGELPEGSIVVLFDRTRFSREDPLDALVKMRETVRKGLNFYFSANDELVTKDNVTNFTDYILHLATGAAANEESQNRSNRTTASYQKKIMDGAKTFGGALPNWIRRVYKDGKVIDIELIPDRPEVINKIYQLYMEGNGANNIVRWLNANVPVWPEHHKRVRNQSKGKKYKDGWTESYVTRLLTDKRLIGERVFNVGRENERGRSEFCVSV